MLSAYIFNHKTDTQISQSPQLVTEAHTITVDSVDGSFAEYQIGGQIIPDLAISVLMLGAPHLVQIVLYANTAARRTSWTTRWTSNLLRKNEILFEFKVRMCLYMLLRIHVVHALVTLGIRSTTVHLSS